MGLTHVYFLITLSVFALASYPGKTLSICKPWVCINGKLNLTAEASNGSLTFERSQLSAYLITHLGDEGWRKPVDRALDACLNQKKPRRYSMTCPGQETWHCVVDQLIDNCPEKNILKEAACTPVASLLGVKYLFSVNTYLDIERNLMNDHRPSWFLRNYLSAKCCTLPTLFEESVMAECGLTEFMKVRKHEAVQRNQPWLQRPPPHTSGRPPGVITPAAGCANPIEDVNPLDCCDTTGFISPATFVDCGFSTQWDTEKRLVLKENNSVAPTTATTEAAKIEKTPQKKAKSSDVTVLPLSCAKETCVFKKLNVVLPDGTVDREAFSRVLDNFTKAHPTWTSAKGRVVTRCLNRRNFYEYDEDCEINKILACTFDVLSENCPTSKKISADPCRRASTVQNSTTLCQISSSKYRKSRRHFCDFPRLVQQSVLEQCGMTSLSRMQFVKDKTVQHTEKKPYKHAIFKLTSPCTNTKMSTTCVMDKMGVINKYGFLDAFKIKEKVDDFTTRDIAWVSQKSQIEHSLAHTPLYREHCTSTRKIFNVLDTVITNCPASKRKSTDKCDRFYRHLDKCNKKQPFTEPTMMFHHNPIAGQTPIDTDKAIFVHFLNTNQSVLVHLPYFKPIRPPQMTIPYSPILHNSRVAFPNSRIPPTATNSNLALVVPIAAPKLAENISYMYRPPAHVPQYYGTNAHTGPLLYKDNFRSVNKPFYLHDKIATAHSKSTSDTKVQVPSKAPGSSGVGILEPITAPDGLVYE